MSTVSAKPRRLRDGELMLPMDEIIEVSSPGSSSKVWGVGTYRAQVFQGTRTTKSGWTWRVWDVLAADVGGSGFNLDGTTRTKEGAVNIALPILRDRIRRPPSPAPEAAKP